MLGLHLWQEYFEALEVLNQHDFISKSTTAEDSDGYSDRDDASHEPPEDVPVDGELLSEAEGDEFEQPRTRSRDFLFSHCLHVC